MMEYWVICWRVLGYMVGRVRLHGGEHCVTWWGVLGYMVGSVMLHGGEFWVTWWKVCVTWYGVLGYMVESVVLHGMMLDYIEGSVGLPGDSSVREWLFNTGSGGLRKIWSVTQKNYNPPLCKQKHPTPLRV